LVKYEEVQKQISFLASVKIFKGPLYYHHICYHLYANYLQFHA